MSVKKVPVSLITGAAAINKAIDSIASRGKRLDADIQIAGLSVMAHAAAHGDFTLAERLLAAMPKGSRKLALTEWMLAFGTLRLLKKDSPDDAEKIAGGHVFGIDKTRTLDLEGAQEKPWYEFKPEAPVLDAFDAGAAMQALMRRFGKAVESGLTIEGKEAAIAEAKAFLAALSEDETTVAE